MKQEQTYKRALQLADEYIKAVGEAILDVYEDNGGKYRELLHVESSSVLIFPSLGCPVFLIRAMSDEGKLETILTVTEGKCGNNLYYSPQGERRGQFWMGPPYQSKKTKAFREVIDRQLIELGAVDGRCEHGNRHNK